MKDKYISANALAEDLMGKGVYPVIVRRSIEDAPAADVVEVRRGHWNRELIHNEKGGCVGAKMICSCCRQDNKHDERMSYCPNCGAKMDGGIKEVSNA